MEAFVRWLVLLRPLCDAIAELLWLTRQNGRARDEVAKGGVFNVTFDRDTPYQLLRITLPPGVRAVPGNQRQPLSLQHALSGVDRHRQPPEAVRERCAASR